MLHRTNINASIITYLRKYNNKVNLDVAKRESNKFDLVDRKIRMSTFSQQPLLEKEQTKKKTGKIFI
jgi:hypothetical protein